MNTTKTIFAFAAIQSIAESVRINPNNQLAQTEGWFSSFTNWVEDAANTVADGVTDAYEAVEDTYEAVEDAVTDAAYTAAEEIVEFANDTAEEVVDAANTAAEEIVEFANETAEDIVDASVELAEDITYDVIDPVYEWALVTDERATELGDNISQGVTDDYNYVVDNTTLGVEMVTDAVEDNIDEAYEEAMAEI